METNSNNSTIKRDFFCNRVRYHYDFDQCKGWIQYDTDQDASYFGIWVNPETFQILTFAEGDETTVTAPDQETFDKELQDMASFYGSPPPACIAIGNDGSVTKVYDERALFGRNIGTI